MRAGLALQSFHCNSASSEQMDTSGTTSLWEDLSLLLMNCGTLRRSLKFSRSVALSLSTKDVRPGAFEDSSNMKNRFWVFRIIVVTLSLNCLESK